MKKNAILLITCDELNRDTLGVYGNRAIETPNIDALAARGVRYDGMHTVSPWCLPARCAILTGQYPHRSGAYSNFRKCALDNGVPNMFKELKKSGYDVTMFGKCHFAPVPYGMTRPDVTLPYDDFKDYYTSLGLDHLDLEDDKQVSVWFMDDWAKEAEKKGVLEAYRRAIWDRSLRKVFPFPGGIDMHPDVWVADKACDYINKADPDTPFFGWVSFSGPHYPMDAPEEYLAKVDRSRLNPMIMKEGEHEDARRIHHRDYYGGGNIDGCGPAPGHACMNYDEDYWENMRANYNAVVKLIDDRIGDIVEAAKAKFGGDLMIIFTADHGEMLGDHGIWGKHNCSYREVWNVPMIIEYPHGERAGEVRADLVNSCDILPTCLEAAGAEQIECDGASMFRDCGREYTFAEGEGFIAVTDGKYKYTHIQKPREDYRELTDLINDPCEFEDHYGDPGYAGVQARLAGKIIEHFMGKVLP